jgi:microcystin-dependent protein
MGTPYLGEIRQFSFAVVPNGWVPCDGRLLNIQNNTALYALLKTTFGGDGKTNFAVPDLRGRCIVDDGQGPNLTKRTQGDKIGMENVTLTSTQMPIHLHALGNDAKATLRGKPAEANALSPSNDSLSNNPQGVTTPIFSTADADTEMNGGSIALSGTVDNIGANQPHDNMQAFLVTNYYIATSGIYPTRG